MAIPAGRKQNRRNQEAGTRNPGSSPAVAAGASYSLAARTPTSLATGIRPAAALGAVPSDRHPTGAIRDESRLSPASNTLLEKYLRDRAAARNLSPYTVRNYRTDLSGFFEVLAARKVQPLEATRSDLRGYLARLISDGAAPGSITRKVSTIRGFYKYLRAEGILETDPFYGVNGPKKPKRLPRILTPEEVARLIAAAGGTEPAGLRDRALLELLYAAGLRVSEIAGLSLPDIDLRNRLVRVRGKGNKERIGVFGAPAEAAIDRYLTDGGPLAGGKGGGDVPEPLRRPPQRAVRADHGAPVRDQGGPAARGAPPPPAPQLRHPPARRRRRPARGAGTPGPREPEYDAGLSLGHGSPKALGDGGRDVGPRRGRVPARAAPRVLRSPIRAGASRIRFSCPDCGWTATPSD